MGCAPSKDAVFEYNAPGIDLRAYNHQRKSSAASEVLSVGKVSTPKHKKRKSSSSSISSNESHHADHKHKKDARPNNQATGHNWISKAISDFGGAEIAQDENYNTDITNASDCLTNEKTKNEVLKTAPAVHTQSVDQVKTETKITEKDDRLELTNGDEQFNHEQLQTETFITGNYRRDESVTTESGKQEPEDINDVNRTPVDANILGDRNQKHEEKAKNLEEKRAALNYEQIEEEKTYGLNPPPLPLNMKEKVDMSSLPVYTVDDMVAHNESVDFNEYFRMGRRVFNLTVMMSIVQDRLKDLERRNEMAIDELNAARGWVYEPGRYFNLATPEYPPYLVRKGYALTRKELAQVLGACVIGKHENVSRDRYVSSLKESVEHVLEELSAVNDGADSNQAYFKNQLTRWLNIYPNVPLGEHKLQKGTDPNSVAYQLPNGINPSSLRAWVAEFVWDTELDPNIWGDSTPFFVDLCKDSHEVFAGLVASSRDSSFPEIDHAIEGAVAWSEIEQDLFKNDVCTAAQEEIWQKRASLSPKSKTWMEKRRNAIATSFYTRHEWEPEKVTPYLEFVDNLRKSWATFEELCQKPWNPPPRKNVERNMGSAKTNSHVVPEADGQEGGRAESIQLRPKIEAMDSGLDLDSNVDTGRASL